MLAAVALAALVAGSAFAITVPAEPGATFLGEAPTYQAIAADLDDDGAPEVVTLVRGRRGAVLAEAWGVRDEAWERIATSVTVVPPVPTGEQGSVEWGAAPMRLIVRSIDGADRVTLVRQPSFEEPGLDARCCLLIDDLVLGREGLHLVTVAPPGDPADAVTAIDLDGDGTDELLVTRSLTPLGDIGFPTEVRLFRWKATSFGPPTTSRLGIGSGDTPFVLGESDEVAGEEAAIIATLGRPALYRLSLAEDDTLRVEDAGIVAADALGVPVDAGRGVAIIDLRGVLTVRAWPRGEPLGPPIGELPLGEGLLLAAIEVHGAPHLAVRQRTLGERLQVLTLPTLAPPRFGSTGRTAGAAAFSAAPVQPYVGPVPGGGPNGEPAILYGGRLVPAFDDAATEIPTGGTAMASLAGAQPVGFVGPERGWLAVIHAPIQVAPFDPTGGRLDPPTLQPQAAVSVAPLTVAMAAEQDDGILEPELSGAAPLGPRGLVASGVGGFTAQVVAPPGSRVYVGDTGTPIVSHVAVTPPSGVVGVRVERPYEESDEAAPHFRATLTVTTPSGHGYLASWDVRVLAQPPPLEAAAATSLGSSAVEVSGRTASYAEIRVAGVPVEVAPDGSFHAEVELPPWPTAIEVMAIDPVGNEAGATVVGIGLFDYRTLPWAGIVAALVAAAAVGLYLRVPRPVPEPRPAEDDGTLEELEPD